MHPKLYFTLFAIIRHKNWQANENGDEQEAENFVKKYIFDKPKNFFNLEKIRKVFEVDRKISVKEFLQYAFGDKVEFESKDELLELEWEKFVDIYGIDQQNYKAIKNLFKAYIDDEEVREIIKNNEPQRFNFRHSFDFEDYQSLNNYKNIVPQYVQDYAVHLTNL